MTVLLQPASAGVEERQLQGVRGILGDVAPCPARHERLARGSVTTRMWPKRSYAARSCGAAHHVRA